jgi:NADH dehydrogenase/NADH:ubiquinone oxidoreductase subunit G
MANELTLNIDGQEVSTKQGKSLLEVAREIGKDIPTICFHEATTANALCRICVVEVEGMRLLQPACISTMDLSDAPEILTMMDEYSASAERFPDAERRVVEIKDDNPMYVRDYSKCLLCWRCVQVCADDAQYTFALNFDGRGYETQIGTFFDKPIPATTCVLCGQCVGVCPTGALKPKREFLLEQGMSPQEITVLSSGRKRRKDKQT